jgi:hypothetical protein
VSTSDSIFSFLLFRHHGFSILFAVISAIIVAYPLAVYIIFGWQRRANDIIGSLTPISAQLYLHTFQISNVKVEVALSNVKVEVALNVFRKFYARWYGRRYLTIPTIFLIIIVFVLTFVLGETTFVDLAKRNASPIVSTNFMTLPDIAVASIAGAYAFVAWDIILRSSRRTLTAADILGSTIRMLIAVPLGYSVSALVKDDIGAFVAFAAAAFPIQTIQTILQRLLNKQLNVELGAGTEKDQVINLSGVDKNTAERLVEADITTILQLAYCDPVQTCMRTSLNFAVISDISAQALAWLYFEDNLAKLRKIGLRGACEIRILMDGLKAADPDAAAVLQSASTSLGLSTDEFKNALEEIADDPQTEFLVKTWLPGPILT